MSRLGYVVVENRGMFGSRLLDDGLYRDRDYAEMIAKDSTEEQGTGAFSSTFTVAEVVELDGES